MKLFVRLLQFKCIKFFPVLSNATVILTLTEGLRTYLNLVLLCTFVVSVTLVQISIYKFWSQIRSRENEILFR